MNNNDILIRVRYALDIKDVEMVEIFKLGGEEVSQEDVFKMLIKSKKSYKNGQTEEFDFEEEYKDSKESLHVTDRMVESFLNGLIIFKRGPKETKPGEKETPVLAIHSRESVNNILLKKLKIALALSGDDMLEIFESVNVVLSKGELTAVFRKEGHKNYRECGDRYARNFLKGLSLRYRT